MKYVYKLGTNEKYGFSKNDTPYEALSKMLYTLNISSEDKAAVINKTESGLHLYFDHRGETYSIRNTI